MWAILRISGDLREQDRRDPEQGEDEQDQENRSLLVRWVRNNAVIENVQGLPSAKVDGTHNGDAYTIRLFRPQDIEGFLTSNNLPRHEWLGGNSY